MTMYHYFHVQAEFYRQQKPQPVYLLLVSGSQIHYKTNRKFFLFTGISVSETAFLLQSVSIPHNALCHIYLSRTEAQPEQYFEYELQTQPIYHSYSLSPPQSRFIFIIILPHPRTFVHFSRKKPLTP